MLFPQGLREVRGAGRGDIPAFGHALDDYRCATWCLNPQAKTDGGDHAQDGDDGDKNEDASDEFILDVHKKDNIMNDAGL